MPFLGSFGDLFTEITVLQICTNSGYYQLNICLNKGKNVNFWKFQNHFFKIVLEDPNLTNTLLTEHMKICSELFQNSNFFFQGQKINFQKFQGHFSK